MNTSKGRPAIFLDRDGTINVEKNFLHRIEDFQFLPGAPEAIKQLKDAGFLVIVVSNQSGIARGYFDEQAVNRLHQYIQEELSGYGTSIDAFYFCPHHPDEGADENRMVCECRKGAPGMLLQAANEHSIDLQKSFMVGDKSADILAGEKAGCKSLLVLTGYGQQTASRPEAALINKFPDLNSAAEFIIAQTK